MIVGAHAARSGIPFLDDDEASPDSGSINYDFKNGPDFMMKAEMLGTRGSSTPEAVEGSRFAGIPAYVIQSDLLRASPVVLLPTRREICIFSWDPRFGRIDYHGLTFPVSY